MPLAPGVTDYRKRVQYQTYDVTALIKENNIINIDLADGWYRGSCGAWGLKNQYGCETKILAQLEIQYTDGTKDTVATDSSWLWSNDGSVRFADNKDGEIVDANKNLHIHQGQKKPHTQLLRQLQTMCRLQKKKPLRAK